MEGDLSSGPCGQGGDLLTRPHLPQVPQQCGHRFQVIEGEIASGPCGQGGDLLTRPDIPQLQQQCGHPVRLVEGGVGGGRGARAAACSRAPTFHRYHSSVAAASGLSRIASVAARVARAVICSPAPASRMLPSSRPTAYGLSTVISVAARAARAVACSSVRSSAHKRVRRHGDQNLTAGSPPLPPALHAHRLVLAQPGRAVVRRADQQADTARRPQKRPSAGEGHPNLDRRMKHRSQTLRLGEDRRRDPRTSRQLSE